MKHVEGFLAEDGTFFESSIDAAYHEARGQLEVFLMENNLSVDRVFWLLQDEQSNKLIRSYLDVYEGWIHHHEDKPGTSEDNASVLEQPTDGHELVPDVGSSVESAEVPDRRKKHGP